MDRRKFLQVAACSATGFACNTAMCAAAKPDLNAKIRLFLKPFVARGDFSGVVGVQSADGTLIVEMFGLRDREAKVKNDHLTRFGVESVSKLFTVECLKSVKAAGKLDFNDPLSKWIPDFPGGSAITLLMLAQHTSGLARDLLPSELDRMKPHTTEEVVAACRLAKPAGLPGAGFNYSNNGYRVLARVLELAGGGTYADLVRETVFQPHGMSRTVEWGVGTNVPGLAQGYLPGRGWGSVVKAPLINMTNYRGAASFCSTVDDLLKFAATQQPAKAIVAKPGEFPSIGHDGRGHGYVAICYRYPAQQTSIVVAGNIESGLFDLLKPALQQVVFAGASKQIEVPESGVRPGEISPNMLGVYDLFGSDLTLGRATSGAYFVDAGDGPTELISIGTNKLFSRLRYATLQQEIDNGEAVLAWTEPSGKFTLKKKAKPNT